MGFPETTRAVESVIISMGQTFGEAIASTEWSFGRAFGAGGSVSATRARHARLSSSMTVDGEPAQAGSRGAGDRWI